MKKLVFKEDTHQYFFDHKEFTSVTTILKKYAQEFDSSYWSLYKAIKDVMETRNLWEVYKRQVGGWEKVVAAWSADPMMPEEIKLRQNYYLDLWEAEGFTARVKGTLRHLEKENEINNQITTPQYIREQKGEVVLGTNEQQFFEKNFTSSGVFAEVRLYNEQYEVAGTVDKIIKEGKKVHIHDYKTNKKISREGFRGATMKTPLQALPDCSYSLYTLQLSIYAWILEDLGYEIGDLAIIHIPDRQTETIIPVQYRKDLVEKLLKHYAKRRIF